MSRDDKADDKAKALLECGEWFISILAEHPEADKTLTARRILRESLMDFNCQYRAQPPRMGEVFLCACLSLAITAMLYVGMQ